MSQLLKFANNAVAVVPHDLLAGDTVLQLASGDGALFPDTAGGYFKLTLEDRRARPVLREIVHCTLRAGDTLTVQRAMEGTSAKVFTQGFVASNRVTASSLNLLVQASAGLTDLWLGVHSTPPTANLDGGPIATGALYFNDQTNLLYTWDGQQWRSITEPAKSLTIRLFYVAAGGEVHFGDAPDLYGQTLTLNDIDQQPVLAYKNGLLLFLDDGSGTKGDYTVDWTNNRIVLKSAAAANDRIELEQLVPVSRLPPSATDTRGLYDIDKDPATDAPGYIDGVRTVFPIRGTDGAALSIDDPYLMGVFLDGVHQRPTADYTALGNNLTFVEAPPAGTTFWGYYFGVRGGTILTVPLPTVVGQILMADATLHPAWQNVVDEGTY